MFIQYTICVLIILLFWMTKNEKRKRNFILPLSFLIITVFFAIRYNYGLDYWSYYKYYETGRTVEEVGGEIRGTGETWFYHFMNFFPRFSDFIIAHTIFVFSSLYYVTRKWMSSQYYPLFFFLILTMSVLCFNWISALRSTMAASVLWIAFDLFYIEKKRWLPYMGMVVAASFFHTSALIFLILPLLDILILKVQPIVLFAIVVVGLLSTMFFTEEIYEMFLSRNEFLGETYEEHLGSVQGYSIFGLIHNSILLFPSFYVITRKNLFSGPNSRIYVLAVFVIIVRSFRLDFHGRMSAYLFIYVIFALAQVLPKLKRQDKILCMVPLLIWCFYGIYLFYMTMLLNEHTVYSEGNYLHYHTIFEPSIMP